MFISKTDLNAKSLFNSCIEDLNVNDAVWYTCQPLAKRTYSGFMTDLCKQAKCITFSIDMKIKRVQV
jgi:hypothetical protein